MYTAYAVRVYPDLGTDQLITGIERQTVHTGSEEAREINAGERFPRHVAILQQNPGANFSTFNVAVALGIIGTQGLTISSGTGPGLEFYEVSISDGDGQPVAGSNHRKITMSQGLVYPTRLSAQQDGQASLECMATAIYDGTNAPLIPADSAALPGTYVDPERFSLGAITVGGVTVTNHLSLEIDFGLQVKAKRSGGDVYPTHLLLEEVKPMVRIRGAGVEQFAASGGIPLAGQAATQANTSIYLRKRLQTAAGFVADATAEHILFNVAGLAYWTNVLDAQGNATAELELVIAVTYDGTNAPVVVDTATTLS